MIKRIKNNEGLNYEIIEDDINENIVHRIFEFFIITLIILNVFAIISVSGIGIIALPTGILSTGFIEEFRNMDKCETSEERSNYCPHCGKKLAE